MNKQSVKSMLMSMRNAENEAVVNYLLGKIDTMDEAIISAELEKIGNSETNVRQFFERKIAEKIHSRGEEKYPINEMFTYGTSGNCIHLHLPGNLHQMMKDKGITGTVDTVNLHLLDAIDRIHKLKKEGFHRFEGKDSIYMISPILRGKEIEFLQEMEFQTHTYKKSELRNSKFVEEHPEAQLAVHIFGADKNIGSAAIDLNTIGTPEWQAKKQAKIQEYAKKGIVLNEKDNKEK